MPLFLRYKIITKGLLACYKIVTKMLHRIFLRKQKYKKKSQKQKELEKKLETARQKSAIPLCGILRNQGLLKFKQFIRNCILPIR